MLLSTTVNKVDKKGRVSVPASFRTLLTAQGFNGVVVFRSISHPALEGWGIEQMEGLAKGIEAFNPFSEKRDDFAFSILADAAQLPFDPEGRILLPEKFLAHAKISENAAFVGRGKSFQIWDPGTFDALQDEARARAREGKEELKLPMGGGS
ncbi:MAG: division/cell wall cluster transcriptional repressor MraZ [Alphaproteobacteria bacterium]|nr:division/cell wall cluster transcriptional repressor MraZ [Alphaproteobacteria bacterium]